eukprot:3005153-Rhodomonas_salina.2
MASASATRGDEVGGSEREGGRGPDRGSPWRRASSPKAPPAVYSKTFASGPAVPPTLLPVSPRPPPDQPQRCPRARRRTVPEVAGDGARREGSGGEKAGCFEEKEDSGR